MVTMLSSGSNSAKLNSSGYSTTASSNGILGSPEHLVSCTTFNILAPIYKRVDQQDQSVRESEFRASWFSRNKMILNWLLFERSTIICLQEFWIGNNELMQMYEEGLGNAGYVQFKLARTNNRGDGLLTAINKDYFRVINYRELLFNDFGDRVAQLLHVQSVAPFFKNCKTNIRQEIVIINTHLLFPHDSSLSILRLHQVYKLLQSVESYLKENKIGPLPIILCGDWNGSKRGQVYKFLRSQGFVSSYDVAHQYTDSDADAHRWVSHRNHRGDICGVDFIWLRNPNKVQKPLNKSWSEAVFAIIKVQLKRAELGENDAFAFLKADNHGDIITYAAFCEALRQINLYGVPYGLSHQDVKDLWAVADTDGNGVVDFEEFRWRIWSPYCSDQEEKNNNHLIEHSKQKVQEVVGFKVKTAALFPEEVEKGMWPEQYSLSDHARLTVVFYPVRMICPQPII